jgi:hypothetical protein
MSVLYVKLYRFAHKPETKEAFVRARDAALRNTSPQENEIIWHTVRPCFANYFQPEKGAPACIGFG